MIEHLRTETLKKLLDNAEKIGIELMTNATLQAIVEKRHAGELSPNDALAFSDLLDKAKKVAIKRIGEAVE